MHLYSIKLKCKLFILFTIYLILFITFLFICHSFLSHSYLYVTDSHFFLLFQVSLFAVFLCLCFAVLSFPVEFHRSSGSDSVGGGPPSDPRHTLDGGGRVRVLADGVWRICYIVFSIYAFVPLRIYVALVIGTLLPIAHLLLSGLLANGLPALLWKQVRHIYFL